MRGAVVVHSPRLAVDDDQLAVELVDGAEAQVSAAQGLLQRGHAVVAAVEEDVCELELVGGVLCRARRRAVGAVQRGCCHQRRVEGHPRILASPQSDDGAGCARAEGTVAP